MTKKQREKTIKELREICTTIGCSGVDPDMCLNRPHTCEIIRKLFRDANNSVEPTASSNRLKP